MSFEGDRINVLPTTRNLIDQYITKPEYSYRLNLYTIYNLANHKMQQKPKPIPSAENIFLFIPNIIGYGRIILALVSFYYMPFDPLVAMLLYLTSCLLDAFDGAAARKFGQGTKFGAVLDMLTDRCCTTCLIMMLCNFYPTYLVIFQLLVSLDITSHWTQMYATLTKGGTSHKNIRAEANPLLRIYYKDRVVLFLFCACAELFYVFLYLMFFYTNPVLFGLSVCQIGAILNAPIFIAKQIINVFQLQYACLDISAIDIMERQKAFDKREDKQTVCSETSNQ